ncbi:MAG: hypothetical protein KAJ07_01200 [Planctomycetes bacterium]|nr:hypothetical protein [Planctomycetota bacterium]
MKQLFFICMFGIVVSVALADYSITWHKIDAGGSTSTGGSYTLTATIGSPDADTVAMGSDYVLSGGFWPGNYYCIVSLTDLSNFMSYWLDSGQGIPADLDGNNKVDNVDFSDFVNHWMDYCPDGWQLK